MTVFESCGEADRRARRAKRGDLVVAVENFGSAVADGARIDAERVVQHGDVVGHQRLFVAVESGRDLGDDVRQIDFQSPAP